MAEEYLIPEIFKDDLFNYYFERPPHRWILLAPERSGTGIHLDPLYTSAWLALCSGQKRWVLFPPDTDPRLIGGTTSCNNTTSLTNESSASNNDDDGNSSSNMITKESVKFFLEVYPRLKREGWGWQSEDQEGKKHQENQGCGHQNDDGDDGLVLGNDKEQQNIDTWKNSEENKILIKEKEMQKEEEEKACYNSHLGNNQQEHRRSSSFPPKMMLEILQNPGEIVFVPPGWWHAVLNLDDTASVTHNYLSRYSMRPHLVWPELCTHQPEFAPRFYRQLRRFEPDIARQLFKIHMKLRTGGEPMREKLGIPSCCWKMVEVEMPSIWEDKCPASSVDIKEAAKQLQDEEDDDDEDDELL